MPCDGSWSKDLLLCGSEGLLRFEARTPLLAAEPAKGRRMTVMSVGWLLMEYIENLGLGGRGLTGFMLVVA